MIAKTHRTRLLGAGNGLAFDLDLHPNTKSGKVMFSFDSRCDRDHFLAGLQDLMEANNCWGGLEVEPGEDR